MDHEVPESLPRRQTDPLWIQDYFLAMGHGESTPNATATFVKRKGHHYMVTCRHVLQMVADRRSAAGDTQLTMALQIDRTMLNLSHISPQGLILSVRTPEMKIQPEKADIALASLEGNRWNLLSSRKNKAAIDLDSWREPDWAAVRYCLATGYQNKGKYTISSEGAEKVATPFLRVVAELCSAPDQGTTSFTLMSELNSPHDYGFSGMSGGAVYAMEGNEEVEDEELLPIGIIYEGLPSNSQPEEQSEEQAAGAFFTDRDIMIRALLLTPDIFDDWLTRSGF